MIILINNFFLFLINNFFGLFFSIKNFIKKFINILNLKNYNYQNKYKKLMSLLIINFNKNKLKRFDTHNVYKKFNPKTVMKLFKKICIKKRKYFYLNLYDYLIVLIFKIKSKYYYIRHKIYYFSKSKIIYYYSE